MPRYDDRHGNTRLYVGHLSSRTRSRDLDHIFSRYGRVRDVDMKHDFAFVDFSDPRDADDARYSLNGREVDGSRITVEFSRGVPRGSREYLGRGPQPGSGRCFNCGMDGHWARDCKAGDWKNKCYRCGERGHVERNCKNSPKKLRQGHSYSRSPIRSRSPRRERSRSRSYSRGRSNSRSRSPEKRQRSVEREQRKLPRSNNISPKSRTSPPPSKGRKKRTPSPDEGSPRKRVSSSPMNGKLTNQQDGSDYSSSPGARSRSPLSPERESPTARRYISPKDNGPRHSPSPGDDRSPVDDDDEDDRRQSPKGSEST